jgi:hypothetical protein
MKRYFIYRPHSAISQKMATFITTAVRTSNSMNWNLFLAARVSFFRAQVLFGALLAPLIVHPSDYYSHFYVWFIVLF